MKKVRALRINNEKMIPVVKVLDLLLKDTNKCSVFSIN
jgi:hypothetical protein